MENTEQQPPKEESLAEKAKGFFAVLIPNIQETFNIREGAAFKETAEGIKRDISFRGYQSWILIFSILIASIGLNVGSPAVIIGAMLISPLMGPILGIGLSVGTNDFETLLRSLRNFGIMVALALTTSTVYFLLSPLGEPTLELTSRIKPTLLDILVALFGGLAGIIAGSRKEKSNVVPGVAIATALMPPLCTAGYGLANGEWNYFLGALYLFLLNSVFISIATFLVVRYMRFPLVEFLNPIREKRIKRVIFVFVLVVIVPSGFIFVDVIKESFFNQRAEEFIRTEILYSGSEIINEKVLYSKDGKRIEIFLVGEQVPSPAIEQWKNKMESYKLEDVILQIHQQKDVSSEVAGKLSAQVKSGILEELYTKNQATIKDKDDKIALLEQRLYELQVDTIPLNKIFKELKVNYPELKGLLGGRLAGVGEKSKQILLINVSEEQKEIEKEKISNWLRIRLDNEKLEVQFKEVE